jgi:hypothetical protein
MVEPGPDQQADPFSDPPPNRQGPEAVFEHLPRARPKHAGRPGAGTPSWQPSPMRRIPLPGRSFDAHPAGGRRATSRWPLRLLVPLVALAMAAAVAVLGFVNPGLFVARVFDDEALQDGVRLVLERDFHLGQVTELRCPRRQPVEPHTVFLCAVRINGAPSTVPVVVQDRAGRYAVGRPS